MEQWPPLTKLLHWLMAVFLFAMLGLGFGMTRLAGLAAQSGDYSITLFGLSIFDAYQLHKSVGVLLFGLVCLRVFLRSVTKAAKHSELAPVEQLASRLVHITLYCLMLGMPLSGWMLASAAPLPIPTIVFGLFPLPHPIVHSETAGQVWSWLHFLGGLALLRLAAMHVAAALKHHLWNKDGVLTSMLPVWAHPKNRTLL